MRAARGRDGSQAALVGGDLAGPRTGKDSALDSWSRLAAWAAERRAVHELLTADWSAAAVAGLALAAVGVERAVEVAALAVHVHVELVEAGAAGHDRLAQHVADVGQQAPGGRA